jgi:hypothetical protein
MDTDTIITRVTGAGSIQAARDFIGDVPPASVRAVADQLHIEAEGHGLPWIRNAIVSEARA